jgi:hypothetical protein
MRHKREYRERRRIAAKEKPRRLESQPGSW